MTTSLTSYRPLFLDRVLDLLWCQWSSLGVAGHAEDWQGGLIDPEALVLATCFFGRFDARLFDAMLEWTGINGRYLNVGRVWRILSDQKLAGEATFRALAETAMTSVTAAKWAKTRRAPGEARSPEPFFFLRDGRPMPVVGELDPGFVRHGFLRDRYEPRRVAHAFRPERPANLLLRLRAMFGVNARCEIIAYLLVNRTGSPREIARQTGYFPATIANALAEMRDSGFVIARPEGRRRVHRLVPDTWQALLVGTSLPRWRGWASIFGALESIWNLLRSDGLDRESPLAQASTLRRMLLGTVVERVETNVPEVVFGDLTAFPGEALLPHFLARANEFLDALNRT
ncbi:MAG: helix-turn-helix domain-containing protein [Polyangia bacterium]|jgi:hypothetical protein|nr:helix-turn-helix domain-containing protein [Polyangia bacterium]